uniref:Poly [ADP-ribose] polymerase n=1 Tax=Erpetoichthys calabaricus TaxID=27687 RepID=A0A8C4SF24_ERPCA
MAAKSLLLQVRGLPDNFEAVESKLQLYFMNKRKSGGEVLEIRRHPTDNRKALLVYEDDTGRNKVLSKEAHHVDFKNFGTVKLFVECFINEDANPELGEKEIGSSACKESSDMDNAVDIREDSLLLLCHTDSESINDEILKLHFEQFCEELDIQKEDTNKWILKCASQDDREKILSYKAHKIGEINVFVELLNNKAHREKCDPRRFTVTGFSLDCKISHIEVYLKSCSHGADLCFDIVDKGQKLIVTFKEDIDREAFIKKCSKKTFLNKEISVFPLQYSNSVLVLGDVDQIQLDEVKLYFSDTKRSKGGAIKTAAPHHNSGGVIITFEDHHAAQRVAGQTHELHGTSLQVYLYYESFQQPLTGKTHLSNLPNVQIPVEPVLLDYILHKKKLREELEESLQRIYCKVIFDELPDECNIILQSSFDQDTLLAYNVADNWTEDVSTMVHSFLKRYPSQEFTVDRDIWEEVQAKCLAFNFSDLSIYCKQSANQVVVVGEENQLAHGRDAINNVIKTVQEEFEEKRNAIEEKIVLNNSDELAFLLNFVYEHLGEVESKIDEIALAIIIKGHRTKVEKAKKAIEMTQSALCTKSLDFPPNTEAFLRSIDLELFKFNYFFQNSIKATVLLDKDVKIMAVQEDLPKAVDLINDLFRSEVITLSSDQEKLTEEEDWKEFFSDLEKEMDSNTAERRISITFCPPEIRLGGFSNDVTDAAKKLRGYLDNKRPVTEVIPLKYIRAVEFVENCIKLTSIPEIMAMDVSILFSRNVTFPCLKVSGVPNIMKSAVALVKSHIDGIVSETYTYDKAGESKVLEKHRVSLQAQAKDLGCMLWVTCSTDASKMSLVCSQIWNSFHFQIIQGDIRKQNADALVCPLNGNLTFDNPLAMDLHTSSGDEIKQACEELLKTKNVIEAGTVILSNPGKLPFQKLLFAVTPIWGKCNYDFRGKRKEEIYLHSLVQQCLKTAEEEKCASVALPVLGCGQFGFQLDCSARVLTEAIMEYCESQQNTFHNLREIFVVDPDVGTIEKFNSMIHDVVSKKEANKVQDGTRDQSAAVAATPCPTISVAGFPISLKIGDITKENVDAIVNSTNSTLDLNSGVSGAILKAAGSAVKVECKTLGAQPADGVVCTGGGNLSCKHIVQMVGPTTAAGITSSVEKVLEECAKKNLTSVSFPAIGTGKGNIAPFDSIEAFLKATENYFTKSPSTSLKSVAIVAFEQKIYDSFKEYFSQQIQQSSGTTQVLDPQNTSRPPTVSIQGCPIFAIEVRICNVTVAVKKGDLTLETVQGIVNTTNKTFNSTTGVSGAIFKAAGSSIQDECKILGSHATVDFVVTSGGSLNCDFIIHLAGPKTISDVTSKVEKVLQECEKQQISTLSVPAIGTGGGTLKARNVINAMLQGFENHLSKQTSSSLKLIYIVVDKDNILQDFVTGIKLWSITRFLLKENVMKGATASNDEDSKSDTEDASNTPTNIDIKIGTVKLQVEVGDLTSERTEAIVNSTNATLDLSCGVSGAILKAAGQSVADECQSLGAQPNDGVVITKPGNLTVKHIIHMVGQTSIPAITKSVEAVLKLCEEKKITSVSFPALGTGAGNLLASDVATAMIDAIRNYNTCHKNPSVSLVRVVIFQQKMMLDFEAAVKKFKRIVAGNKGQANAISKRTPENVPNRYCLKSFPISTVEVYGRNKDDLSKVSKCIDDLIREECCTNHLDSEYIRHLLGSEQQEILTMSEKKQIEVDIQASKISVTGKRDDVLEAVVTISKFLQNAKEREARRQEEERIQKIVQWETVGKKEKVVESSINYDLELAYQKKEKSFTYVRKGKPYNVDLEKMIQTNAKGRVKRIRRVPLTDPDTALIELPEMWTDKQNPFSIVVLPTDSEEYTNICKGFMKSCQHFMKTSKKIVQVVQIERIQNRDQWEKYAVKKKAVDRKYPNDQNECILYHGTTKDICQKINKNGFNRSFCGRNATKFGQGTYFAKEAWYSCEDQYSNPDENGLKYIYRARVIKGKVCQGSSHLKEPSPVNPGNPNSDLCDCAVDNLNKPFIFVIFCDFGAYPEYLLTLKTL